jgi:TubC N-terminal docking domain
MTTLDLLQQLRDLGMVLTPDPDGTIRYKAPKGVLTPVLREALSEHKAALHALVEAFEERAVIMEYDGRIPRDEAERLAWACIQSARDVCAV